MVSPTSDAFPYPRPAPLAWKEFRRRSGLSPQPKVYVYDASPQIVPHSPTSTLSFSPILTAQTIGQESPRKDHSGYLVSHVTQALQTLGSSTGGNIADYIANNFSSEQGIPYEKGRKLHYMVNAILSSPKYKYIFLKDQVLKDEKRSLWRLKQPGDTDDDSNNLALQSPALPLGMSLASLLPPTASLSSLIPPTSPTLSLNTNGEETDSQNNSTNSLPTPKSTSLNRGNQVLTKTNSTSTPSTPSTPSLVVPSSPSPLSITRREGGTSYGGSDESDTNKKIAGVPRTTEHPPITTATTSTTSTTSSSSPSSPSPSPSSPVYPSSPPVDTPPQQPLDSSVSSLPSLSSRRKRRKSGLDSSVGSEVGSPKLPEERDGGGSDDKKRRYDVAAA